MENFEILDKLGEGSFSVVYKVKRKIDNQIYALKKVKLDNLKEKNILNSLNEVRILASVKSNYVISYKEAFHDENENTLIIVMEYADNGDLYNLIKKYKKNHKYLEESEIWKIFIQLIKGLKSLHDLNILHRDLKSANVFLFNNGLAKLGDLNVAKVAKKGLTYTQTGTPYYASPEVWKDLPYDFKSDIWSLGCVLYEMITLNVPFKCDMRMLYKKVIKGEFKKIPCRYSKDLDNIVHLLIQVNQDKRPTCQELLNNKIIKEKIDFFKNSNIDNIDFEDNNFEKSILMKTIEMPKNISRTPLRLPKPNYSKDENEKCFDALRDDKDEKSMISEQNKSLRNNYNYINNNILPIINNSKKEFYKNNQINFNDYVKLGLHKIFFNNNTDGMDNNNDSYKEYNHNKNLINNYNLKWIKLRNIKNNFNKINNNSYDAMKIIKLYKPPQNITNNSNIFNQINMKQKNKSNEHMSMNINLKQSLPKIERKFNKDIYSQIKIIPKLNQNLK